MSKKRVIRGLEGHQEQDPSKLIRDTRTLGQRVKDFFDKPFNCSILLIAMAVFAIVFSGLSDLVFIIGMGIFLYSKSRKQTLPFRMPQRSGVKDYNDMKPGGTKPNDAQGICFFGNQNSDNAELWFNNDDMRTHCLIFGSTGSGKTETLVSLAYNALMQGSGLIYVDGKGDNSLFSKVFSLARSMGREDDILLINFMTGARDVIGPQEFRLSNTMNPFANGSSSMLSQLVTSLMDSSGQSGDGDMWKGRAISFVESLMKVLVYMRDDGKILLDANTVRQYFALHMIEPIGGEQKMFPRQDQEPVSLAGVPEVVIEPIKNYLINLPGYDFSKPGKQSGQTLEQHGFITMQLGRVFTSLADTYGHIIRTNIPEVDFKDVVLNRRILVVLLPALEKSPDELANLGKIIVSSLKAMMASGLGTEVEGSYKDVIQKKPTNAKTPFMCILDEYGYYAVEGFAVVPAQARSLGFSAIFAGQDLPAFQKASKEEALSIGANTNIKICMKLEDPIETWDFFSKTAGEAFVTKVDSFQTNQSSVMNSYVDTRSSSSERRARIDLLDLKDQDVGEMHIFFKSKIVRAKSFFANPRPTRNMRLNHFLKIDKPPARKLINFEVREANFLKAIQRDDLLEKVVCDTTDVSFVRTALDENEAKTSIERSVAVLLAYHDKDNVAEEEPEDLMPPISFDDELKPSIETELTADFVQPEEPSTERETSKTINVFSRVRLLDITLQLIGREDLKRFSGSMLKRASLLSQIELTERVCGRPEKQAASITKEMVRDIEAATEYPPEIDELASAEQLVYLADEITDYINNLKQDGEE